MKLTTTLKRLRENNACIPSYDLLIKNLGADYPDDADIDLKTILESNGVVDCVWALRAVNNVSDEELRVICVGISVKLVKSIEHVFKNDMPDDRPGKAIKVMERWLETPCHNIDLINYSPVLKDIIATMDSCHNNIDLYYSARAVFYAIETLISPDISVSAKSVCLELIDVILVNGLPSKIVKRFFK